jgi:DNA topoisomerase-6 subunit B
LAYGGASTVQKVSLEMLEQLLDETDARTLRQFLLTTFDGLGSEGVDKILKEAEFGTRLSPNKLKKAERERLHEAMRNVNVSDGQTMQVLRYANRVPLQFKQADCAITRLVMNTNWRSYGLTQSRGNLPNGPVTLMVHMASVWVPFTSESKEAVASYPEIEKELRLALQSVGRKLKMFLRKRQRTKQEGDRRNTFLRYLGEVAQAVHDINGASKQGVYDNLLHVAKRVTADADAKYDQRGNRIEEDNEDYGDNVLIVEQTADELLAEHLGGDE